MATFLFLSPHLDDVAFSCTGEIIRLASDGHRCVVGTPFTRSVPDPGPFALACQLDKGLDTDVDYMAIRRGEDLDYITVLNNRLRPTVPIDAVHGDLPEAPHRGYDNAAALFGPPVADDAIAEPLAGVIAAWINHYQPTGIYLPMGYGNHIDHRRVLDACDSLPTARRYYRDTPYVLRPDPGPPSIKAPPTKRRVILSPEQRSIQLDAIDCYRTQVPFQYGSSAQMRRTMTNAPEWILG